MSDGGKGSGRRPSSVSDEQVANNWNSIFGISRLERKRREQALIELVRINEELGLYDDYDKPTRNNQETQEIKLSFVK